MEMIEDIREINTRLEEVYGSTLDYKPNFRLVWGPSMVEKKFGTFEEWYMETIFLRRYTGVKECLKYPPGMWGECWILERIFSSLNFANRLGVHAEPPKDVYNWDAYEPVWSFKIDLPGGKHEPVRPIWRAVDFVVRTLLFGPKQSLVERWDEKEGEWKEEAKEIRMMLDDDLPWRILQMKHGEGVVVPKNFGDGTILQETVS